MIALTIVGCVAVFVSSMLIFRRELDDAMQSRVEVAASVVDNEIEGLKDRAHVAAFNMARNTEIISALKADNRAELSDIVNELKNIAQVDYSVILDTGGNTVVSTHVSVDYGVSMAHMPHVESALAGRSEVYINQNASIHLGIFAGSPIYDEAMNLIGAVSLGFRLDSQEFVSELKKTTGCELSVFSYDVRVATTIIDQEGLYAIGTKAPPEISDTVLAGMSHLGFVDVFGRTLLAKYQPLFGAEDDILGMIIVGYDTTEDNSKIVAFIINGLILTAFILLICLALALPLSGFIKKQMQKLMVKTEEQKTQLAEINSQNEMQLTKLNLMVKSAHIGLWDFEINEEDPFNPKNPYLFSDDYRKMVGYESEEDFPNIFESWLKLIHPYDERRVFTALKEHLFDTSGMTPYSEEFRIFKKDGTLAHFGTFCETIRDEDGNPLRASGAMMDITDVKERANFISTMNERILLMLNTSPLCTIIWDKNQNIIEYNKASVEMYGFGIKDENLEELIKACSPELQPDGQRSEEKSERLMKQAFRDGYCHFEWMHIMHSDGSLLPTEVTLVRVKYGDEDVVIGYTQDMREYKAYIAEIEQTQERLRQARDTAEAANRSKSIFLANMSHEIRTPMNSIIGFSELAQDDSEISSKTRKYLSNISDNAIWLLDIINDILDNTKIESGKITLEHISFDIQDVITQCQAAILPKTVDKGFALYCYTEPIDGKKIVGDPIRLRQVLMNLLSNAVKFTEVGTIKLFIHTTKIDDTHVVIKFEVKDSGIGMTPEQIGNIFEPYMQADDSVTRKFGGTGLGLPIASSIVKLMGGDLTVVSKPGAGSTFSFELEFELVESTADADDSAPIFIDTKKPQFDALILICEDNFLNQQVVCDHLSRVGIRTIVANNGQEGVDIVANRKKNDETPFDLIFMDIHMPIMDGLEAARLISVMDTGAPVVALTANIMANDVELYKAAGMLDLLSKPFTSQDLWKCLLKYIPVVDYVVENAEQQAQEEDRAMKQLRTYFVSSNQATYDEILNALSDDDIKLAHRIAHTLKSNAGQIGEKALQKAAAEVEFLLVEGKPQVSDIHATALKDELDAVLEKLESYLTDDDVHEILTDETKIREIIDKIEPILMQQSTECMSMMDEIKSLPGAQELAKYVDDFEFKKAIAELSLIKERLGIVNGA